MSYSQDTATEYSLKKIFALAESNPNYIRNISDFPNRKIKFQTKDFQIYKSIDAKTKKKVFVKEVSRVRKSTISRFCHEVRAFITSNSPFISKLVGFTVEEPYSFIIEQPEGMSFHTYLKTVAIDEVPSGTNYTRFLLATCQAMSHIHNNGFLFRALSPSVIYISNDFKPTIFTIDHAKPFTSTNVSNSKKYDIYLFGVLIYCMCEKYDKIISELEFPTYTIISKKFKSEFTKRTPQKLRSLIKMCISTDQEKRPTFEEIFDLISYEKYVFRDCNMKIIREYSEMLQQKEKTLRETPKQLPPIYENVDEILQRLRFFTKSDFSNQITEDQKVSYVAALSKPSKDFGKVLKRYTSEVVPDYFYNFFEIALLFIEGYSIDSLKTFLQWTLQCITKNKNLIVVISFTNFFKMKYLLQPEIKEITFEFFVLILLNNSEIILPEYKTFFEFNMKHSLTDFIKLCSYFIYNIRNMKEPLNALDIIITLTKELINIDISDTLLSSYYYLLKDNYNIIQPKHKTEIYDLIILFLNSKIDSNVKSAYKIAINLHDNKMNIPYELILMHCGLQSFQWYAIDLLGCFNNIPPEEYIFGAIYSAARYSSHGTLALYNFISISPQHANFLTRFSDWMLIPLPTIIDTYKLLVLLYIYPNIRATLSHTKEFPRLLRKIIQIHDNKIFVTIGSLLKRSIVDPRLFAQLESSGFFKEYFEYVQNSESSSVLSSALVTCSFLADIEFSNAYLLCLQRFANCAKGKSNLKNYAIQVIVALSKHKEARSMLRSSGLMEMFQEMKGEYDNLAQQFFENMEKD